MGFFVLSSSPKQNPLFALRSRSSRAKKNQVLVRKKTRHPELVSGAVNNKFKFLPETKGATIGARLFFKKLQFTASD